MTPQERIRLRRNPKNVATPSGYDDLYFDEDGNLIHESARGVKETVGGGETTASSVAAVIVGSSAKATPVDADVVGIVDSAASNALKKLSWENIKATLKLYFDTLYMAVTGLDGVMVTKANGTRRCFVASANTEAARGLALEAAFAAAVAGDTIDLSPGNYDVAKSTSTVIAVPTHYEILSGMTVRLNGARLYHQEAFNGAVFFGADGSSGTNGWAILGPGIIEGTQAKTSGATEIGINTRNSRRWLIADLTVRYFRGTGIQFNGGTYPTNTEYGALKGSTGKIINCHIDLNNIGLTTGQSSELLSVVSCTFNQNLTACDLYAGATNFTACEVMWNTNYGLRVRNYGNSAHCSFVGGVIAHNFNYAIDLEATNNGLIISGCVLGGDTGSDNKIASIGGGLIVTGCIIDCGFYSSTIPTGINQVYGNHMTGYFAATTDLSAAERLMWKMHDNWTVYGGPWPDNDAPPVFANDAASDFSLSCTTTNASKTVTTANTTGLLPGMTVTGTGIAARTHVVSITNSTTFTISVNATASATNTLAIELPANSIYKTSGGEVRIKL